MSNNLELMKTIANTSPKRGSAFEAFQSLRRSAKIFEFKDHALNIEKKELPAKNYCEQDLDTIFNGDDRFEDTWWRF